MLKAYIKILLMGLDFLHSECKMIHTGECSKPCEVNHKTNPSAQI